MNNEKTLCIMTGGKGYLLATIDKIIYVDIMLMLCRYIYKTHCL